MLKGFYEKAAALVQEGQAPPPGFDEYKKNENAGGVMGMIQTIINDAENMEKETIRSEEDAQKAYEDFVKETNTALGVNAKEIVDLEEELAKDKTDKVQTERELDDVS